MVSNPLPGNHLCDILVVFVCLLAVAFQTRFRETTSVTTKQFTDGAEDKTFQIRFRETTSVTALSQEP